MIDWNITDITSAAEMYSIGGDRKAVNAMLSYLGRVNYAYDGKYLFEFSFRSDASSKFAPGYRRGFFPSGSAAWRISEEPFFEPLRNTVSNLKLRASYGSLGNTVSGSYDWQALYSTVKNVFNESVQNGLIQSSIQNLGLSWEKVTTWDIGLDLGLFNNRLTAELDFYQRNTSDILTNSIIYKTMGTISAPMSNTTSLRNRGFEMSLGWADRVKGFSYGINLNLAFNKNVITDFKGDLNWEQDPNTLDIWGNPTWRYTNLADVSTGGDTRRVEGHMIDEWFLRRPYAGDATYYHADGSVNPAGGPRDGIIRTKADLDWVRAMMDAGYSFNNNLTQIGPDGSSLWYGDQIMADVNGDGKYGNDDDREFTGKSSTPKVTMGLNLYAQWKGIDVSMVWAGRFGSYHYLKACGANENLISNVRDQLPSDAWDKFYFYDAEAAYEGIIRDEDGTIRGTTYDPAADPNARINSKYPRLLTSSGTAPSNTHYLQNTSYVKLKSLQNILFGNSGVSDDGNGIGVPLYLEPVDPDQCNKVQSPESEVWAQVIQDLTDAINEPALPDNQIGGEGRVSKGTAYALRGRAYLITKEYGKAVADFKKVGECGFGLFGDYKQLFKVANERCEEMIMSLQYIDNPSGYGTGVQKYCAPYTQGAQDRGDCWTDLTVTPALVNLYEEVNPDGTVKDFAWEDYLGEAWTYVTNREAAEGHTKYRKVFFIRDKYVNGMEIHSTVTEVIDNELANLPEDIRAYYLPEGNEARLKTAYAHRDPRLAYNVVTPYANYLGINKNATAEGWYTYRYPVVGKFYLNDVNSEPSINPNLPDDYYASGFCNVQNEFKYIHRKFIGEGREYMRRDQSPIDEPIIRYADVLLMEAEAEVEQGHLQEAKALVAQVRDRVGISTPDEKFNDKETARNYVRDERRREFVNEGVNFFDEMRWRTLKETKFSQVCAQHAWGGSESTGGTTYNWIGDQWYTWPVPKSEIELNPAMTPTPGWVY